MATPETLRDDDLQTLPQDLTEQEAQAVAFTSESKEEGGDRILVKPNPEGDETIKDDDGNSKEKSKKKPTFEVHGMVRVGTEFIPDFFDITSPDCAMLAVGTISNKETRLGLTLVRVDNFKKDPNYPFSQATVLNPHWSKDIKNSNIKGNANIKVECKYNLIDKAPEANSFTPDIVGTYSTNNGWIFEGVYTHKFQNGGDADAFRLGVTKIINEEFKVTLQTLYDSGFDKKFAGNLVLDFDLGNGLGFQCGCVYKNGFQLQAGVLYQH